MVYQLIMSSCMIGLVVLRHVESDVEDAQARNVKAIYITS